jgi:Protein of unknown function (DUF3140)
MSAEVDDELWQEFHTVVNMTSRELEDWLRTRSADEDDEALPDQAGTPTGRHVVQILGKRRGDLTDDDARVMRRVVERVRDQRRDDLEPTAGDPGWRHRLMSLGHDPLKPTS